MTKTMYPAGCGKKFITADHAEKHADATHPDWKTPKMPKARGWTTPFGFVDFREPVTYEQACQTAEKLHGVGTLIKPDIEAIVSKLVKLLSDKGIKVIDFESQNMMRRAIGAYLESAPENPVIEGIDYMLTITGNFDELRINFTPLSESGLAFFKKHRMCPANMKLAKVEMVDVKVTA